MPSNERYQRLTAEIHVTRTDCKRFPYRAVKAPRSLTDAFRVGLGRTEAEAIADTKYEIQPATRWRAAELMGML